MIEYNKLLLIANVYQLTISFRYYHIPIGPRLQQMMEVPSICRMVQHRPAITVQRDIGDLHSSPAWQSMKTRHGGDVLGLSFCSDGFNPWHHHITQVLIMTVRYI